MKTKIIPTRILNNLSKNFFFKHENVKSYFEFLKMRHDKLRGNLTDIICCIKNKVGKYLLIFDSVKKYTIH